MTPETHASLASIAAQLEEIRRLLEAGLPQRKATRSSATTPAPDVAEYIAAVCAASPAGRVVSADLYAGYSAWASENARQKLSTRAFGLALRAQGFTPSRGANGCRYWVGLRWV